MDQGHVVRHQVLVEGRPPRSVARELGLSRTTVGKYGDQVSGRVQAASIPEAAFNKNPATQAPLVH